MLWRGRDFAKLIDFDSLSVLTEKREDFLFLKSLLSQLREKSEMFVQLKTGDPEWSKKMEHPKISAGQSRVNDIRCMCMHSQSIFSALISYHVNFNSFNSLFRAVILMVQKPAETGATELVSTHVMKLFWRRPREQWIFTHSFNSANKRHRSAYWDADNTAVFNSSSSQCRLSCRCALFALLMQNKIREAAILPRGQEGFTKRTKARKGHKMLGQPVAFVNTRDRWRGETSVPKISVFYCTLSTTGFKPGAF